MPSAATLKTPSCPSSAPRTIASAASSSCNSCRRGSKPANVGTSGSDRYRPRVVPSLTRKPRRSTVTRHPGVRSENSWASCSISSRSRLSPYAWRSEPATSSVRNDGSAGFAPYTAWLDFTTRRFTGLLGPAQPARTFIVPMTLVSCSARCSPGGSAAITACARRISFAPRCRRR